MTDDEKVTFDVFDLSGWLRGDVMMYRPADLPKIVTDVARTEEQQPSPFFNLLDEWLPLDRLQLFPVRYDAPPQRNDPLEEVLRFFRDTPFTDVPEEDDEELL